MEELFSGLDERKVVSKEEISRLLQSSGNLYADEVLVRDTSVSNIDAQLFEDFIFRKTGKRPEDLGLSHEQLLSNLGMLRNGNLTLGGLLLFGRNPQQFKPMFTVQCISFFGNKISSTDFRDKEDPFTGNIQEIYKNTISFVTRNLRKIQVEPGFNSRQVMEIPLQAIEELLVNALIHRDYHILSSIKVFIFDDRLEIVSPGRLPNTLTVENIRIGTSIPRNPILFTNARHFLPFVGVGSGIPRALESSPGLMLTNDLDRDLSIASIKRPEIK